MIELNKLASQIYKGNAEKGFWDKSSKDVKDEKDVALKLMLITSELGEAMEAHRKGKFSTSEDYHKGVIEKYNLKNITDTPYYVSFDSEVFQEKIKDTFEDEIADALIRILDMCGGYNIDIQFHVENKLKYNATREKLHGKKY